MDSTGDRTETDSKMPRTALVQPVDKRDADANTTTHEIPHDNSNSVAVRAPEHTDPWAASSLDHQFPCTDDMTAAQAQLQGEIKTILSLALEKAAKMRESTAKAHGDLIKLREETRKEAQDAAAIVKAAKKKLKDLERRSEQAVEKYLRALESTREIKQEEADATTAVVARKRELHDLSVQVRDLTRRHDGLAEKVEEQETRGQEWEDRAKCAEAKVTSATNETKKLLELAAGLTHKVTSRREDLEKIKRENDEAVARKNQAVEKANDLLLSHAALVKNNSKLERKNARLQLQHDVFFNDSADARSTTSIGRVSGALTVGETGCSCDSDDGSSDGSSDCDCSSDAVEGEDD